MSRTTSPVPKLMPKNGWTMYFDPRVSASCSDAFHAAASNGCGISDVPRAHPDAVGVGDRLELLDRPAHEPGMLDALVADVGQRGDGALEISSQLIAQRVELNADLVPRNATPAGGPSSFAAAAGAAKEETPPIAAAVAAAAVRRLRRSRREAVPSGEEGPLEPAHMIDLLDSVSSRDRAGSRCAAAVPCVRPSASPSAEPMTADHSVLPATSSPSSPAGKTHAVDGVPRNESRSAPWCATSSAGCAPR